MKEQVVFVVGTVVGYFATLKIIGYVKAKKEKEKDK